MARRLQRRRAAAVLLVPALDVFLSVRRRSLPVLALVDWTAHLVTTALAVGLVERLGTAPAPHDRFAALGAAVAIDADHLPSYLHLSAARDGRPVSHSLALPAAVLAGAALVRPRRRVLLWTGLGLATHLARDAATGPGLRAGWPFSGRSSSLPYGVYLAALGAVGVAGARVR